MAAPWTSRKPWKEKVKNLTVSDVNKAILKYIKPYENWTVINCRDFKEIIFAKYPPNEKTA